MSTAQPPIRICVFCAGTNGKSPADVESARELARALHEARAQLVYGGGTGGLMGELARERVRLGGPGMVLGVTPISVLDTDTEPLDERLQKMGWAIGAGKGKAAATKEKGSDGSTGAGRQGKRGTALWKWSTSKEKGRPGEGDSARDETSGKPGPGTVTLPPDPAHGQVVATNSLAARKAYMMRIVEEGSPGSGFVALSGGFGTLDEVAEVLTMRMRGVHSRDLVLVSIDGFWDPLMDWLHMAASRDFVREGGRRILKSATTAARAMEMLIEGADSRVEG